jgi:transposase
MGQKVTPERIRELTLAGLSVRQIAAATGVSTQRVYQVLDELGVEPAKPKKEAVTTK